MIVITGEDRSQLLLLPDAVDDYLGPGNAVRFIDAFIDGLDLEAAGFLRVRPTDKGRAGYDLGLSARQSGSVPGSVSAIRVVAPPIQSVRARVDRRVRNAHQGSQQPRTQLHAGHAEEGPAVYL